MNKPDWKDAPEWAEWLAQIASGDWYWYEEEPNASESNAYWQTFGRIAPSRGGKIGPKEPRPKPTKKMDIAFEVFAGDLVDIKSMVNNGGISVTGPCTITITEGVGQSNVKR